MITEKELRSLKFELRDFIAKQILENELDQEELTEYLSLLLMSKRLIISSNQQALRLTQATFDNATLIVQTFYMIRNNYS